MIAAPLPPDEAARLAELTDLDLTGPVVDARLDAIATLAAEVLGLPIALVSIVGREDQRFVARHGLDVEGTGRDVSFCAHVVAAGEALVVHDALGDERFSDNPLVTGDPHIRFYAGVPLRTASGHVLGTLCAIGREPHAISPAQEKMLRSLGDQVLALMELRRSARLLAEQRAALGTYARFFELGAELFCTTDREGRPLELNAAWQSTLGWTAEELRGRQLRELVHPDDDERTCQEALWLLRGSGVTVNFENRLRHRDGHWVPLAWSARVHDQVFYAAARDLTDGRLAELTMKAREAELQEGEIRLRAVFDAMEEGVVCQTSRGEIVSSNPAAGSILGLTPDQLVGRSSVDPRWRSVHADGTPFPGEDHPAMTTLRTGEPLTDVIMGVHKPDGSLTWISINTRPMKRSPDAPAHAVVCTFRDITEQRAAEARAALLARQERLVTTGTLAAGVGHEINNPLSYILNNLEFALEELRSIAGGSPAGRLSALVDTLVETRSGAERIRRIVRGLKALARDDGPPVPTDVAATVEIAVNMSMYELRQRAAVSIELPALPLVLADEARLTQVLVNLLVNAGQAFRTNDPSKNRVTVSAEESGDHLWISVTDNGPGIAADVLPRIFDPFFTTKPVGRGTGLGLSISQSIVTALQGELTCTSEVGGGTTFRVRLPVARDRLEVGSSAARVDVAPRGRILVVDDSEGVVRSLQRILEREHEVACERDPRSAWTRLEAGERFDVVLCDLMMPYVSGLELYIRASEISADLAGRFVFITGGVLDEDTERVLESLPNERLEKPVSLHQLRSVVRRFVVGRR